MLPGVTSRAGFTRSPPTFTWPARTRSVAALRVFAKRAAHSHLSTRTRSIVRDLDRRTPVRIEHTFRDRLSDHPRARAEGGVARTPSLALRPAALAPEPQGEPLLGPVTAAAEAAGVRPGMRLGEALATCPSLALVEPDAAGAERAWEEILRSLEDAGFAVDPAPPASRISRREESSGSTAGSSRRSGARSRRWGRNGMRVSAQPDGASPHSRQLLSRDPGRSSWSLTRSCRSSSRRCRSRSCRSSVTATRSSKHSEFASWDSLPGSREAPSPNVWGRTAGAPGAWREVGRPRACAAVARPPSLASLEFPEAIGNELTLRRALVGLIDTALARPERRDRFVRKLALAARLESGGSWRRTLTLREPSADPDRIRVALSPRLAELPSPVVELRLELVELDRADRAPARASRCCCSGAGAEDRTRLREGLAPGAGEHRLRLRLHRRGGRAMVSGSASRERCWFPRTSSRRFNAPRAARVEANANGFPVEVNHQPSRSSAKSGASSTAGGPKSRSSARYFELVLETGENTVVFHDGPAEAGIHRAERDERIRRRSSGGDRSAVRPFPRTGSRTFGVPGTSSKPSFRSAGRHFYGAFDAAANDYRACVEMREGDELVARPRVGTLPGGRYPPRPS